MISSALVQKIEHIQVKPDLKDVLRGILTEIERSREQAVTTTDFKELKDIVRDLAVAQQHTEQRMGELTTAQQRTEQRMGELTTAQQRTEQRMEELTTAQQRTEQRMEELATAQQRTEQRMEELATAQQRTEQRMEELATAQQRTEQRMEELAAAQQETTREVATLSRAMKDTRTQVGGLAHSMAYALENEAYRKLPQYLRTHYQIEVVESFVRTEIGGEEVNFFAKARQHDADVVIVGESVLKLDDPGKLKQLHKQVAAVQEVYQLPVLPLIVTHYARPKLLAKIEREGILVVQSFHWE